MAKKKTTKKVVKTEARTDKTFDKVVEKDLKQEQPTVVKDPVNNSLNALSANREPVVTTPTDSSSFNMKGITAIVEEIVEKHFTTDKKLGFKAISNQLQKMLN